MGLKSNTIAISKVQGVIVKAIISILKRQNPFESSKWVL